MSRRLIVALMAVLLLLPVLSSTVAGAEGTQPITLTGKLEYVVTEAPHYEVAGYVLISQQLAHLQAVSGQHVRVVGTEFTGPSIYMQKALVVSSITLLGTSPGLEPIPAPDPDEGVTTPMLPPDDADGPVAIPAPPVPFFGTSYYVLFGRITATENGYLMVQHTPAGQVETPVSGAKGVDLERLVGQQVGVVASRVNVAGGQVQYRVLAAIVLTDDLSEQIQSGTGLIYTAPPGQISVRLRGKLVFMDQPPVVGNGRTLVGLRAISTALGADIDWDQATRTATIVRGDRQILVTLGSNRVIIRETGQPDQVILADVTPIAAGGRILVPVRVLAESLGLTVGWETETRTVTLE